MAKGYLDRFIKWLATERYSTTGSTFLSSGSYGTVSSSECALAERCGIVSFSAEFTLKSTISVSATGAITSPAVPFYLATLKSDFYPGCKVPFTSYGQSFQFYGYIDDDGKIYVTGGQARGSAYTISSGYKVRIGATYALGVHVLTESLD